MGHDKAIHRPADRAQGQAAVRAGTDDDRQLQLFTILHIKKQSVHYRILRSYKDTLHVPSEKVSPNITKMTAIGCFVGAFIAATIIVVLTLLDTKIHDEEYLLQTYNLPVLAVVPNLYRVNESSSYYGTYGSSKKEKDEVK